MSVTVRERPGRAVPSNGGVPARRAIVRWAWRLLRHEWRQQLLILALITVAVAVTFVGSAVATNTPLYRHMVDDMDINAGVVLEGTPVEEVGRHIFEEILAVASGKKTKSELAGVGEEEFAPWQIGPTL